MDVWIIFHLATCHFPNERYIIAIQTTKKANNQDANGVWIPLRCNTPLKGSIPMLRKTGLPFFRLFIVLKLEINSEFSIF